MYPLTDVLNSLPGKIVPVQQTPIKKTALSDLKNTNAAFNTPSDKSSKQSHTKPQFSGALLSSVLQAKTTFVTPHAQPMRGVRTEIDSLIKTHKPLIAFDEGTPLKPVDFLTSHANGWLLNDEQIERIASMTDTYIEEPMRYDIFAKDKIDDYLRLSDEYSDWDLPSDFPLPLLPDDEIPMLINIPATTTTTLSSSNA